MASMKYWSCWYARAPSKRLEITAKPAERLSMLSTKLRALVMATIHTAETRALRAGQGNTVVDAPAHTAKDAARIWTASLLHGESRGPSLSSARPTPTQR